MKQIYQNLLIRIFQKETFSLSLIWDRKLGFHSGLLAPTPPRYIDVQAEIFNIICYQIYFNENVNIGAEKDKVRFFLGEVYKI